MNEIIQLKFNVEQLIQIIRREVREAIKEEVKAEQLYTKKDACRYIGISFNTLQKHIKEGRIRTTPDGRISRLQLDKFLNGGV